MKRAVILSALVVAGLSAVGISAQRGGGLPPPRPIEKISDNLYKVFGGGGNTTIFLQKDGVVLVDTKMPGNGQAILDELRKVTDLPVKMIINTHAHPDHLGSNDFFKESSPTIDVVMHDNAAKSASTGPFANPATKATITFADKKTLGSGKDQIDLYHFGPGHTNGDTFVVFPSEKAMAAGDIMAWNMAPLIDSGSGGTMVGLPDTLEKAIAGIKGVDKVIEGHGHVNTWQGFKDYAGFMRAIVEGAKVAVKNGETPGHVVAKLEKEGKWSVFLGTQLLEGMEYGGTPKSRALIDANVAMGEIKGEPVPVFAPAPPSLEEQEGHKAH